MAAKYKISGYFICAAKVDKAWQHCSGKKSIGEAEGSISVKFI